MAPKKKPWFRCYSETFTDPKIRTLKPDHRWLWLALLGAARQSPTPGVLLVVEGVPFDADGLADWSALPAKTVKAGLALMVERGMLTLDGATYTVARWSDRQYASDSSTGRSAKARKPADATTMQQPIDAQCNGDATAMQRPREQKTETDTPLTKSQDYSRPEPAEPSVPVVDDQIVRRTAVLVGKHQANTSPGVVDLDAYAAGITKRILTGPDLDDLYRITLALAAGDTPETIAAGWVPDPIAAVLRIDGGARQQHPTARPLAPFDPARHEAEAEAQRQALEALEAR